DKQVDTQPSGDHVERGRRKKFRRGGQDTSAESGRRQGGLGGLRSPGRGAAGEDRAAARASPGARGGAGPSAGEARRIRQGEALEERQANLSNPVELAERPGARRPAHVTAVSAG